MNFSRNVMLLASPWGSVWMAKAPEEHQNCLLPHFCSFPFLFFLRIKGRTMCFCDNRASLTFFCLEGQNGWDGEQRRVRDMERNINARQPWVGVIRLPRGTLCPSEGTAVVVIGAVAAGQASFILEPSISDGIGQLLVPMMNSGVLPAAVAES